MPVRKSREPDEFQVRLKLIGKDADKFHTIKERFNLKSNADVVRFIINEEYRRIVKDLER